MRGHQLTSDDQRHLAWWCMVCGVWCMVYGAWHGMVHGMAWCPLRALVRFRCFPVPRFPIASSFTASHPVQLLPAGDNLPRRCTLRQVWPTSLFLRAQPRVMEKREDKNHTSQYHCDLNSSPWFVAFIFASTSFIALKLYGQRRAH